MTGMRKIRLRKNSNNKESNLTESDHNVANDGYVCDSPTTITGAANPDKRKGVERGEGVTRAATLDADVEATSQAGSYKEEGVEKSTSEDENDGTDMLSRQNNNSADGDGDEDNKESNGENRKTEKEDLLSNVSILLVINDSDGFRDRC